MPRIAVVGSCITRDLWPIRGGGWEQFLYISRTSFASLLSSPVAGFVPSADPPGGLRPYEHAALTADLQKTALAALMAYRPSHIIFDFIDERFDLIAAGDSITTRSAELLRSGYLAQPGLAAARIVPRLSDACERLWLAAAAEFAAVVRATPLRNAQLILHSARWATHQRTAQAVLSPLEDVEVIAGEPAEIAAYNTLLERQEAAFTALMPPMAHVGAGELRFADGAHKWGLSPFHYVPEYYEEVRRQLSALGLSSLLPPRVPQSMAEEDHG